MTIENVKKLEECLDSLIEKHEKCINNNDFGGALNIMKNITEINRQFKDFGDKVKVVHEYISNNDNCTDHFIKINEYNGLGSIYKSRKYRVVEEDIR